MPGVRCIKGQIAQMFTGHYQHNLDDKGRLMIPARFRESLEGEAFITQGFDKCLMVMAGTYFKQVVEHLAAMTITDPTTRLLRRLILANAFPVEVDKVGRIVVPQPLRVFIEIEGEAIVAGQGEYFEVWTPAAWKEQMAQIQDTEANNQRFAALDISSKP
jgi:MraZ protein